MKKFKKFYIEITNVCNLSCDFCPSTKRRPEFMKIEDFSIILDQIKEYTDYIYFHVKGEPLLHPDIDKFLDISYEKGFKVNLTTNGTLLIKMKEKLIRKPALRQINVSLHSFDGNEGDKDKNEYIENILTFTMEAIQKSKVIISLRLWNLDENNEINLVKKKNNELLTKIEEEFKLPYKIKETVVPGEGIKIADRIYLNQAYQFQWPDIEKEKDDGVGFCYGLRDQVAILVDGTVVPCCLDGEGIMALGNIHENEFTQIIESNRVRNIIDGFSRRQAVEDLCRTCGYRKRFGT